MNENPITITIDNYKGQKLTFTVPEDAQVDIWKTKSVSGPNKSKLIEAKIYLLYNNGIDYKEEGTYNG